jgi:hypothetical protein
MDFGDNAPPSGTLRLSSEWMYLILPVCCGLVEGCTCRCQSRVDLRRRSRKPQIRSPPCSLGEIDALTGSAASDGRTSANLRGIHYSEISVFMATLNDLMVDSVQY